MLIVVITIAAIYLSLRSIFASLDQSPSERILLISFISVPLGWLTLHTIAAFHYAHRYYSRSTSSIRNQQDAGGLNFPETDEPTSWDFLYYSFVVGMTAQVSDVQVLTTPLRLLTLAHGVVSFFFNVVILALAVSLATGR